MSKIPSETQDQLNYESLQKVQKMMSLEVIIVQDIHFHCRLVPKEQENKDEVNHTNFLSNILKWVIKRI